MNDMSEIDCMVAQQGAFLGPESKCEPAQVAVCKRMRGACCTSETACNNTLRVEECKIPSLFVGYGKRCHLCSSEYKLVAAARTPINPATGLLHPERPAGPAGPTAAVAAATTTAASAVNLRVILHGEVRDDKNRLKPVESALVNLVSSHMVRLSTTRTNKDGHYEFALDPVQYEKIVREEYSPYRVTFTENTNEAKSDGKLCNKKSAHNSAAVSHFHLTAKGGATRFLYVQCLQAVEKRAVEADDDDTSSESSYSVSDDDDVQVLTDSSSSLDDGNSSSSSSVSTSDLFETDSSDFSTTDSSDVDDDDDSRRSRRRSTGFTRFAQLLLTLAVIVCLCCGVFCCLGWVNASSWDEVTGVPSTPAQAPQAPASSPPSSPTQTQTFSTNPSELGRASTLNSIQPPTPQSMPYARDGGSVLSSILAPRSMSKKD